MATQSGKINVQTENIFPIIKKFLYSDHEIFLRELVSNAVDACQKIKTLSTVGEAKADTDKLKVEVVLDKDAKTLTIRDNGIGMTAEEVEKYITQIAFSGAEEFVNKYKDKADAANSIIGHFGLGFYSSFMVSSKVEILTKSHVKGSTPVRWECDGSPDYTLVEDTKKTRGTDIILHIADDSLEFLEEARISALLTKYCKFLPVEIIFNKKAINNTQPAWTKKPVDLKDEDYTSFYKELYPFSEDPLFHIHLNVDYPFNLTGILFFPKLKRNFEVQKDKIQLYCNQVFVTDSVENIVPDFLTLLQGVIDSPDIPLNVSRSYLQSDANVKKISAHITKKVADKLEEIFKKDRNDFESKWNDINLFIKYGMLSEEKFYEKAAKFFLFKNTENKYFTIEEYAQHIKAAQTDKDEKMVHLYTNNPVEQHSFVETAKERGYDVLVMDGPFDSHFVNHLEMKLQNCSFVRVDADTIDKLIKKEEAMPSKLSEEQQNTLKPIIEAGLPIGKFTVQFESLSEKDQPMIITQPEFMRRMKDMSATGGGGMNFMGSFPETYNMIVNSNHPIISKILDEKDSDLQKKLSKQTSDLALLSQGMLKGEELTKFIKRSLELI
ncbi:MAG: molecular chaperone HtpG [Bacteroidetes bacterium]|nr:molecular chaperone HtpG [Bacteroidota bacterium]MBK9673292.1 molecular chaperone HtpG [Bacteroidota bacterium]MBP6412526.1 molecular chaperone HtpG [Bacteroidia bacterium]